MEEIHQIANKFFLLRKRLREPELQELASNPNSSFYNTFKTLQAKTKAESQRANLKFVLDDGKKSSAHPEGTMNPKGDLGDQLLSPASSMTKIQKKVKSKKPNVVNKLPRDDLINIAFNQNAPPKIILQPPMRVDPPKLTVTPLIKKEEQAQLSSSISKEKDKDILMLNAEGNGDRTPALELDSSSDSFIKESTQRDKEETLNHNKNEDDEKENENNISDYFDNKEIFDNNNIFNDDDDIIDDKPFEDYNNSNRMKAIETEDIVMKKEPNKPKETSSNIISIPNHGIDIKADNEKDKSKGVESKEIHNQLDQTKGEEQMSEENPVETIDTKVIISLKGFENYDFSKNDYFKTYNNMSNNDGDGDDKMNDGDEAYYTPVTLPVKKSTEEIKQKAKEEMTKNKLNIIAKSIPTNKKSNKIIDDDDEREYVYLDEKKDKGKDKEKPKDNIKDKDIKPKQLPRKDNPHFNPPSLSNTQKAISNDSKKLKEKPSLSSSIKPNVSPLLFNKPQTIPLNQQKTPNLKTKTEGIFANHYHTHQYNSNINNITFINNTIIPSSSNSTQVPQAPTINNEIKKKEYDIVCLSILNTTLNKIKTKLLSSNDKSSSASSAISTSFEEMINMTIQIRKEEQAKRIKLIIDKTMKMLMTLFEIFENEAKREQFIHDILQILEVIDNFQRKTKDNYGEKIPQSFKTIKLVFKYIMSLFKMKGYTTNYMKTLIEQEETTNKTRNLLKFTKTFKSFNNSVDKLKKILSKDSTEDRKQKKLNEALYIYLETNPNAIKYSKCFKVGKKFIEYIFDYLSNK